MERGSDGLDALFEDLEQQAAGMDLAERDAELPDRVRGEYAGVTLAGRVHASLGLTVSLVLHGGLTVDGTLSDAGSDWCAVSPEGRSSVWLVPLSAVVTARGMSPRAVPEVARPVTARLGFGSALHRYAAGVPEVLVQPVTGMALSVRLVRVGADFLEVDPGTGAADGLLLVPSAAVSAVRVG